VSELVKEIGVEIAVEIIGVGRPGNPGVLKRGGAWWLETRLVGPGNPGVEEGVVRGERRLLRVVVGPGNPGIRQRQIRQWFGHESLPFCGQTHKRRGENSFTRLRRITDSHFGKQDTTVPGPFCRTFTAGRASVISSGRSECSAHA